MTATEPRSDSPSIRSPLRHLRRAPGRFARLPHRLAADLGGAERPRLRAQPRCDSARGGQRRHAAGTRSDAEGRDALVGAADAGHPGARGLSTFGRQVNRQSPASGPQAHRCVQAGKMPALPGKPAPQRGSRVAGRLFLGARASRPQVGRRPTGVQAGKIPALPGIRHRASQMPRPGSAASRPQVGRRPTGVQAGKIPALPGIRHRASQMPRPGSAASRPQVGRRPTGVQAGKMLALPGGCPRLREPVRVSMVTFSVAPSAPSAPATKPTSGASCVSPPIAPRSRTRRRPPRRAASVRRGGWIRRWRVRCRQDR